MVRADIVKKGKKEYVKVECNICHRMNYYPLDMFKIIIKNGFKLHCKYCGSEINITVWSDRLERVRRRWKK